MDSKVYTLSLPSIIPNPHSFTLFLIHLLFYLIRISNFIFHTYTDIRFVSFLFIIFFLSSIFFFYCRSVMANMVSPTNWANFVVQHFHQLYIPATVISGYGLYQMKTLNTMVFKRYSILYSSQPQVRTERHKNP